MKNLNPRNGYPILFFIAIISITFFSQCSNPSEEKSTLPEVVRVGFIAPLSGPVADLGEEMRISALIAFEQMNARDLPGPKIEMIPLDDELRADKGSIHARDLSKRAVGIIGTGLSSVVKAEVEVIKETQIPLITSTATSSDISQMSPYAYRIIPSNFFQASALAQYAFNHLEARKVAVIYQEDEYALDLRTIFESAFRDLGGEIIISVGFEKDESDYRIQLQSIVGRKPDVLLIAAQHTQLADILIRAREMNLSIPVLSGETGHTDKVLQAAKNSAEGLLTTGGAFNPNELSKEGQYLNKEYRKRSDNKNPGAYGFYTYDAALLFATAIRRDGRFTAETIKMWLDDARDFPGATGKLTFNENGDVSREYDIFRVKDGQFIPAN